MSFSHTLRIQVAVHLFNSNEITQTQITWIHLHKHSYRNVLLWFRKQKCHAICILLIGFNGSSYDIWRHFSMSLNYNHINCDSQRIYSEWKTLFVLWNNVIVFSWLWNAMWLISSCLRIFKQVICRMDFDLIEIFVRIGPDLWIYNLLQLITFIKTIFQNTL